MSTNAERVPMLIAELTDVVAGVVRERLRVAADDAQQLGREAARKFCREFQGELVYIPRGTLIDIDDRDREMYAWFCAHGRNYGATARQFELGVQHVYRRIKLIEYSDYVRRQLPLFPTNAPDDDTPS